MNRLRTAVTAALILTTAVPAGGQEAAAEQPVTPNTRLFARIEKVVIAIQSVFGRPLHPIISGVGPGGGWGAGVGYDAPGRGPWDFRAKGIWTLNNYKLAEAVAGYRNRRAEIEVFGRWRDMKRLEYFGSGNETNLFDRTSFSYRDPVLGVHGKFRVAPWIALGGRFEEIWPYARSGKRLPSIEMRFFPADAPGLFQQPLYGRYQGSVDVHLPAGAGDAFYQGTKSRLTYAIYDQQDAGFQTTELYNFRRFDAEVQQIFAGLGAHHRLTLSGWASISMADAGQEVPFFLQRTLGGKSELRSVSEDRLGSDGTQATLRGYRNLRFRDDHSLLLQAEYRVPVWGPIDATVFADAGKVASTRSELDLSDLRHDVGFSLSVMKGWATAARVDVGFGSGEGTRVFFTIGGLTP